VTWNFVLKIISWELIEEDCKHLFTINKHLFGHLLLEVITIIEAFGVRKDNLKVGCEFCSNRTKYYRNTCNIIMFCMQRRITNCRSHHVWPK